MLRFQITILGCGAATPTLRHFPTSQLVNAHEKLFLIDCGEGTQVQLRKYRARFQRIDNIFISHMHGDHFLGLMGLLSSMHLLGRKRPLTVHGPESLKEVIVTQLRASQTYLSFHIEFKSLDYVKSKELIFEDNTLKAYAFPLDHRVPCTGFIIEEKPKQRRVRKEAIKQNKIQLSEILVLKAGEDVQRESGEVLTVKENTIDPPKPRSYAFCSDTAYSEAVIDYVKGATVLYHEATFLHEMSDRATETKHTTAKQAGIVAEKAEVSKLVIGHFSSRYRDEQPLLDEAKLQFENTELAEEGKVIDLS